MTNRNQMNDALDFEARKLANDGARYRLAVASLLKSTASDIDRTRHWLEETEKAGSPVLGSEQTLLCASLRSLIALGERARDLVHEHEQLIAKAETLRAIADAAAETTAKREVQTEGPR